MLPTRLARLVTLVATVVLVVACSSTPSASSSAGASTSGGSAGPSTAPSKALSKVRFVLPWVVQGESAANLVAKQKGFYTDAGLDVEIVPGGPDVRAAALLASGSAEFSAGPVSGILTARAQDIPLVALYTQNQSDGLVWVCKNKTGIKSFKDLAGKRVGVWFGSNDAKLLRALDKVGVAATAVQMLPQKFSMIEFFEDKFDCAGATVWNELHVVLDAGYTVGTTADDITILDPAKELGIFVTGDSGFTTEKMIQDHPDVVQAFVTATIRGYQYALKNPEEAAAITVGFAKDLDLHKQLLQVEEMNRLLIGGAAAQDGIGTIRASDYTTVQDMLLAVKLLKAPVDLSKAVDLTFWKAVPADDKAIGDANAILERIKTNTAN